MLPRWTGVEAVRTRTSVTRESTGIRFISEVCPPWLLSRLDTFYQTAHAQRFSSGSSRARCPEPASITTEGCLWTVPQGHWSPLVLDADDQLDRLPADGGYRLCNDGARSLCFQRMPMRICIDRWRDFGPCGSMWLATLNKLWNPNGKSMSLRNPVLVACASRVVEFFPRRGSPVFADAHEHSRNCELDRQIPLGCGH